MFRKQNRIKVYGSDVATPFQSFRQLDHQYPLHKFLKKKITLAGYQKPTPIQMQSVPILLEGRDLIGCAPTGSGKTLAFLLPLIQQLKEGSKNGIRAIIISPTRELAQQIYRECDKLCGKGIKVNLLSKSNFGHKEKKYGTTQFPPFTTLLYVYSLLFLTMHGSHFGKIF